MVLNRLRNNRKYILKRASSYTAVLYALLGFLCLFAPLENVFSDTLAIGYQLLYSVLILLGVWTLCALFIGIGVLFKNKRRVVIGRNGKGVYVVYGDLFSNKLIAEKDDRRSICFGVNRCFDTIVDDKLVSSASIHGIAFKKLYSNQRYTPDSLNRVIQDSLSFNQVSTELDEKQKPAGNLRRYKVGTCVDVPVSDNLHYFLVGLSRYNSDLKAETTRSEYCLTIQKMIEFCDAHAQGYPLLMPIIGGFLSRTGQSEKDLLGYMIKCFELNKDHINADYYIVIRESAKNEIAIMDL